MPVRVCLYGEPGATALSLSDVALWVQEKLPQLKVESRVSFIEHHLGRVSTEKRAAVLKQIAQNFAQAKVRDPSRPKEPFEPLFGEINYERRRLEQPGKGIFGIFYDGEEMMGFLQNLIPKEESGLDHIHIAFTDQLFGTFDEDDLRYHARVCMLGYPSILSTSGIVEAPAKPREYYILRQQYSLMRMADAAVVELEPKLKGRVVEINDPRLTELMKGYAMQAIFHHLSGEPFCPDKDCRLYNSHWQEEVIRAQLSQPEFCAEHESQLVSLVEIS